MFHTCMTTSAFILSVLFSLAFFRCNFMSTAGLEKSSVLPVLDRFLSPKTDFVLNRKQKNRSIKVFFFPRPILNNSL